MAETYRILAEYSNVKSLRDWYNDQVEKGDPFPPGTQLIIGAVLELDSRLRAIEDQLRGVAKPPPQREINLWPTSKG